VLILIFIKKKPNDLMDSTAAEQTLCSKLFVYLFHSHVRSL